jgi:hypothetical protein
VLIACSDAEELPKPFSLETGAGDRRHRARLLPGQAAAAGDRPHRVDAGMRRVIVEQVPEAADSAMTREPVDALTISTRTVGC